MTNATGQSVCMFDTSINVTLKSILADTNKCNFLAFSFQVQGIDEHLPHDFTTISLLPFTYSLTLEEYTSEGNFFTLKYFYAENL